MKNTCPRCALCIRRREEDEELDEEDYELIVRLPLTASVYLWFLRAVAPDWAPFTLHRTPLDDDLLLELSMTQCPSWKLHGRKLLMSAVT